VCTLAASVGMHIRIRRSGGLFVLVCAIFCSQPM
jgi:hypothetical protein